jgi:hypothetical protein
MNCKLLPLFFAVLMLHLIACAQTNQPPLELSNKLEAFKTGLWINGDYTIYVDRLVLAANFKEEVKNAAKSKEYYGDKDSNLVNYFNGNATRYQKAADQLENGNDQMNLRMLILYNGTEDIRQNNGSSTIVGNAVKQLVEQGKAIVYYKGKRIFTLQRSSELINQNDILNHGYETRIFYDDKENCIFRDYHIMGW